MNKERNIQNESIFSEEPSPDPVAKTVKNAKKIKAAAEKTIKNANDSLKEAKAEQKNQIPDYESFFINTEDEKKGIGISFILKLLKPHWFSLFLSILFCLLKITMWITPLVTANIINAVVSPGPDTLRTIVINVLFLLFYTLCMCAPFNILYHKYANKTIRNVVAGLRSTLVRKLQHLSITYYNEIESGKIQSKFLRDIESIEMLLSSFFNVLLPNILNLFIYIGISIYRSRLVSLFFLLVIPVNCAVIYVFRKKMQNHNKNYRSENEVVSAKVTNMIEMIPVTKAHGLENSEIVSIEGNITSLKNKALLLDKVNANFETISSVASQILSLSCLVFTSILSFIGKIQVGDIVLFQNYFSMISGSVQTITAMYPNLTRGLDSLHSMSEIMFSSEIEDNNGKIPLRYIHGTVQFENVSYRYPNTDVDVIKNFSLNVEPGESIAFVGASGSGKSTIMNMIIGFLSATGGTIKIDGKPIGEINLSSYRHFISVVPQKSILFKGTIRDNITYGLAKYSQKRFDEVIKMANIDEFTADLPDGLDTRIGEHGDKLSGGQKQRISIARALMRDPKILILDEATSALDNISEYYVQEAISSLVKDRTTFIVAHRLSTIRNADRIIVLEKGKCVEMGTYDELMEKKGKFYELKSLSDITNKE